MNKEIMTAITSIGIAQLLKVPLSERNNGKLHWASFFESGGMPSSHSAGVTSLATYIAHKKGVKTVDFALAAVFGLIVMYDAQGIRRQAGELTLKVNDLDEEVEELAGKNPGSYHEKNEKRLKEMLGHQPEEVLAGALLGVATGSISYWLTGRN
ncbi:divergent PAP2 family protein [Alkalihalobacillus sp. LMS39]|uniref:divergent PAP2 family protein n=1 Tax=Alkalihalobacillus sp. LMS39 TaxID=2924032 RepID=UPI001FB3E9EC|nr:divergent PAP2 family protein [Alkalihalobacillus sp. LMS39]UOE92669.1 divergent PAP2 family protein [Alkalihalobacillus sp. LMS39]